MFVNLVSSSSAICSRSTCLFSVHNILFVLLMVIFTQEVFIPHPEPKTKYGDSQGPSIFLLYLQVPTPFKGPCSPDSLSLQSRLTMKYLMEEVQMQRTATLQKTQGSSENTDCNRETCIFQKRTWAPCVLMCSWC